MSQKGLKPIAVFEALKGLVALLVGLGVHEMSTDNAQQGAQKLVSHLQLNPASYYPSIFIRSAGELGNANLTLIALGAALYSIVRFVEAYGLWHSLRWTEWFALISGAIYLPFEIYEFSTTTSLLSATLLVVNSAIVLYLYSVIRKPNRK
jgi:uncharacterized membrane protein (DUF2068 family)